MNTTDRRVKRTKKLLADALAALMKQKPLKSITVRELTELADLNRGTFYLHFKGGKGIAATAGLLLSFDLRLTLVAAIVFLAAFFLTHYVSLGSLLVYVVFVAGIIIMGQTGQFAGMSQANIYEMYVLAILLAILAYYKHWPNILRLIHGNENKTYLKKKKA